MVNNDKTKQNAEKKTIIIIFVTFVYILTHSYIEWELLFIYWVKCTHTIQLFYRNE